jgi:hypothetical protein
VIVGGGGPGFELRGIREYERFRESVGLKGVIGPRTNLDIYHTSWEFLLPSVLPPLPSHSLPINAYVDLRQPLTVLPPHPICWFFCYVLAENWSSLINETSIDDNVPDGGPHIKGYVKSVLDGAAVGSWFVVGDSIFALYRRIEKEGGEKWRWEKVGKWIVGERIE